MEKNEIVAIVVTYNRVELLKENIEALLNQKNANLDIYIIDNASTDNTKEVVNKYVELNQNVKYFNTGKNLGGAGGFHFGMKQAIMDNYKYAWIMDDDTIPNETALSSILEKAKLLNGKFSYICSLVKWKDNSICQMNKQSISGDLLEDYELLKNNLVLCESCSFVSCFIPLEIAKEIGLPIKEFFIYGDDVEYTKRLGTKEKGYLDLDSIVIHKMKENIGADIINTPSERVNRYYYNYRNWFYIRKKYNGFVGIIRYMLHCILTTFKILLKSKDHKLKRIWNLKKGEYAGIFFNPKIDYCKEEKTK